MWELIITDMGLVIALCMLINDSYEAYTFKYRTIPDTCMA